MKKLLKEKNTLEKVVKKRSLMLHQLKVSIFFCIFGDCLIENFGYYFITDII